MSRFYSELLIFCNLSFPGESATHYLVKNTVRTFKELGVRVHFDLKLCDYSIRITFLLRCCAMLWCNFLQVLKERRENKVTTLELSSTFLPQANRNKLLQYILGFTLLWPRHLLLQLGPQAPSSKGLLMVTSKQSQVLLCGKLYQEVPSRNCSPVAGSQSSPLAPVWDSLS